MSRLTRTAFIAVGLLATTSLTSIAHSQGSYNNGGTTFVPAQQAVPIVSFSHEGSNYQNVGYSSKSFTKGRPMVQYAPVEYVPETPQFYDSVEVPVVEMQNDDLGDMYAEDDDFGFEDDDFEDFGDDDFDDFGDDDFEDFGDDDFDDADFIDPEIDTLIDELADEDLNFEDPSASAVANFVRLSGGYGFATMGSFNYGSEYDSYDPAEQNHYESEIMMRGPAGAFRADVASFFLDGGFGYFTQTATNEVDDDIGGLTGTPLDPVGPTFALVDGTQTDVLGSISTVFHSSDSYFEGDILKTTYDRTSTLIDFGGAAGYSFKLGGSLGLGLGIGGRRIQGSHIVGVTQVAQDADGTAFDSADFVYADHELNVSFTGNYVGPVVRINFDQPLSSNFTAHLGGSAQALYGNRTLDATQTYNDGATVIEMDQVVSNGFAFGGEIDAGLGYAMTENLSLSVGGFGSFLTAAPGFVAYDTDLVTDGTGDFATMTDTSLITYGLKGSVSLSF